MNNVLVKRIKNALKTESPIDNVREIISQYEEIQLLIRWRDDIIVSGKYYGNYINEIEDVNEKIANSGFYQETMDELFDKEIKTFFEDI